MRAKQKIRHSGLPYRVPAAHLLVKPTPAVLYSDATNRRAGAAASCFITPYDVGQPDVPPRGGAQHRVSGIGGRSHQWLGPPRGGT